MRDNSSAAVKPVGPAPTIKMGIRHDIGPFGNQGALVGQYCGVCRMNKFVQTTLSRIIRCKVSVPKYRNRSAFQAGGLLPHTSRTFW
jgi:hypothetical protein